MSAWAVSPPPAVPERLPVLFLERSRAALRSLYTWLPCGYTLASSDGAWAGTGPKAWR